MKLTGSRCRQELSLQKDEACRKEADRKRKKAGSEADRIRKKAGSEADRKRKHAGVNRKRACVMKLTGRGGRQQRIDKKRRQA
jgi:hypothetical protein